MELHWEGKGVEEKSIDVKTNKALVEVNLKYFCPFAVEQLQANSTKAKTLFGQNPTKINFERLAHIMVECDMKQTEHY